jgi:hypothetical protein
VENAVITDTMDMMDARANRALPVRQVRMVPLVILEQPVRLDLKEVLDIQVLMDLLATLVQQESKVQRVTLVLLGQVVLWVPQESKVQQETLVLLGQVVLWVPQESKEPLVTLGQRAKQVLSAIPVQ